jgi:hypothetical protein
MDPKLLATRRPDGSGNPPRRGGAHPTFAYGLPEPAHRGGRAREPTRKVPVNIVARILQSTVGLTQDA